MPVPSLIFFVHEAIEAMNSALEVIFSAASVTCSPQYASEKPNLSANKKACLSSNKDFL